MTKGLVTIIFLGGLYWGYYYTYLGRPEKDENKLEKNTEDLADITRGANINMLKTAIEIFKTKEGRFPHSIEELVYMGYLDEVPDYGNAEWNYNTETGQIK